PDCHQHAGRPEHATPHLECPAVIVAPSLYDGLMCAQRPFEGPEPLLVRLPLFGPDPERARPGKREPTHTTPPPGGEAAGQTATQARHGLEQMEECRQATQPEHLQGAGPDRQSTPLNSRHEWTSYAVFR